MGDIPLFLHVNTAYINYYIDHNDLTTLCLNGTLSWMLSYEIYPGDSGGSENTIRPEVSPQLIRVYTRL